MSPTVNCLHLVLFWAALVHLVSGQAHPPCSSYRTQEPEIEVLKPLKRCPSDAFRSITIQVRPSTPLGAKLVSVGKQLHLEHLPDSSGEGAYLSWTGSALVLSRSLEATGGGFYLPPQSFLCVEQFSSSGQKTPLTSMPSVVRVSMRVLVDSPAPRLLAPSPPVLHFWLGASVGWELHQFRAKPPSGAEESELQLLLAPGAPTWLRLDERGGQLSLAARPPPRGDLPAKLSIGVLVRDPLTCAQSPETVIQLVPYRIWRRPTFRLDLLPSDCGNDSRLLDTIRASAELESPQARLKILNKSFRRDRMALIEASVTETNGREVRDRALMRFTCGSRSGGTNSNLEPPCVACTTNFAAATAVASAAILVIFWVFTAFARDVLCRQGRSCCFLLALLFFRKEKAPTAEAEFIGLRYEGEQV